MDNKVVNIQVKHNIDQTTKSSNDLAGALKGAANSAGELGGKSDGLGKIQSGIDAVGGAVGQLNPAFGAAIKSSNGLILKMWEMCANPVGAILAAIVITLKFLYESFQSSVEGGKELKAIFAAVSAVGTQVKDAMFGLGRALIDVVSAAVKFITLDFKGAAESMKKANQEASNSYKQLGNAVDGTTYKIMYNLEKQQQANDKARKLQAVVQSETNLLLVKSRETLTDETASLKDKKKALEEVTKAEMASSAEKERIALKDLQIAKVRAKAMGGEEEKKAKQELRDLEIAYNEAQTENAMTGIKLNKQKKMLNRQEIADQKEAIDAQKAKDKELSDAKKKELDERAKNIADHKKAIQDLEKKYQDDLKSLNAKTDNEKLDLQAQNDLAEIDRIAKTSKEKANLMALYNKKYIQLNKELDEKQKALADKAAEEKKAKEQKDLLDLSKKDLEISNNEQLSFDARLQAITDREALEKSIVFKSQEERTAFEKENADARVKIAKSEQNAKLKALEETSKTLSGLADLLGKQTAAGKTAAIASATIETFLSANRAYSATVGIPFVGPVLAPINAGLAVAAGLKNIQSILAVKTPDGGGGGSAPSIGGGGSAPAAPSFNVVGNSGVNQVANVMSNQGMQPVQAYVVANNVTTAQGLNRNIVNNATLG
jgi:hypothetical protein